MKSWLRFAITLTILLIGFAVAPYVALPNESFSWRMFAGAYGSTPVLTVNYNLGAPGSFFTVSGFNFAAGRSVTINVNGRTLGTVQASETGSFSLVLATNGAGIGVYRIVADDATARFDLAADAPLRAREGSGLPTLTVPAGIAGSKVHLPAIRR